MQIHNKEGGTGGYLGDYTGEFSLHAIMPVIQQLPLFLSPAYMDQLYPAASR